MSPTTPTGRVRNLLMGLKGVARVLDGDERARSSEAWRSGELIALAEADAWFAYPFWFDDRQAYRITPVAWTFIANRVSIRASCSSIRD